MRQGLITSGLNHVGNHINRRTRIEKEIAKLQNEVKNLQETQLAATFAAEVLLEVTDPGEYIQSARQKYAEIYGYDNQTFQENMKILDTTVDMLRHAKSVLETRSVKNTTIKDNSSKALNIDRYLYGAAGSLVLYAIKLDFKVSLINIKIHRLEQKLQKLPPPLFKGGEFGGGGATGTWDFNLRILIH